MSDMGTIEIRRTVIGGYSTREEWRPLAKSEDPVAHLDYLCALLNVKVESAEWVGLTQPLNRELRENTFGKVRVGIPPLLLTEPGQLWDNSKHDAYMLRWVAAKPDDEGEENEQ